MESIPQSADLRDLADARAREARVLLEAAEFSGAYHLAGLAIECALKAVLTSTIAPYSMPDKTAVGKAFVHDLERLAEQAGLSTELNADDEVAASWVVARSWSIESRYQLYSKLDASDLVEACLGDEGGVFQWLSARW